MGKMWCFGIPCMWYVMLLRCQLQPNLPSDRLQHNIQHLGTSCAQGKRNFSIINTLLKVTNMLVSFPYRKTKPVILIFCCSDVTHNPHALLELQRESQFPNFTSKHIFIRQFFIHVVFLIVLVLPSILPKNYNSYSDQCSHQGGGNISKVPLCMAYGANIFLKTITFEVGLGFRVQGDMLANMATLSTRGVLWKTSLRQPQTFRQKT